MRRLFLSSFLVLFSLITIIGCKKKEDTIAVIIVKNNANQTISGASVLLKAQGTTSEPNSINTDIYPLSGITNDQGRATFDFNDVYQLGQAGVAVLSIEVVAGSETGQGVIKVEQEQTTEEIVFVF